MYELNLSLQHTPHGIRVSGPDPERVLYLKNAHSETVNVHPTAEPVWSSEEVDLFISPLPTGVELKVRVHAPKNDLAQTTGKAA